MTGDDEVGPREEWQNRDPEPGHTPEEVEHILDEMDEILEANAEDFRQKLRA